MKKFKFLSVCFVVCALAAAFAIVPGAFAEDASADAPVAVTLNGAPVEDLSFSKDEKVTLDAQTDLEGRIRWQYLADEAENLWVSVYGENSASFTLTYAKVFNMLNDENAAQIRCAVGEVFSDPVTVTLKEQSAPIAKAMSASPFALTRSAEEEGTGTDEGTGEGDVTEELVGFDIVYSYLNDGGATDIPEFSRDFAPRTVVHLAIGSPVVEGYTPDIPIVSETISLLEGREVYTVQYSKNDSGSSGEGDTSGQTYTMTVNFVFDGSGETVYEPNIYHLGEGGSYTETIQAPKIPGYLPYVKINNYDYDKAEEEYAQSLPGYPDGWVLAEEIELIYGNVCADDTMTVYYRPTNVDYTVIYYQQNVDNDQYTEVERETKQALTGSQIPEITKTYNGFTQLLYSDDVTVAADGSTVVEVYYDRNYYLVLFNLDGGYGVEPVYGRFGAPLNVATPAKAGYSFTGWDAAIPATIPVGGGTYTAQWEAADTTFRVAYWLEDPDNPGNYDYWCSYQLSALSGTTVSGETYKNIPADLVSGLDTYDYRYSEYATADGDVKVEGDGSTVVNVKYNRKEYTLKFYYAMSYGSGNNIKYYVVGGSTYKFGSSGTNTGNSLELLDSYYNINTGASKDQCGQVKELPTLNGIGVARNYKRGSDYSSSTRFTYYYLSFNAKYGADLSKIWPCNVFNTVERSATNKKHNRWSKTTAVVSAWNGEHHVYYSQHNSNQTIKGNFSKLDYQLLWDYTEFGDSPTVDYLCFWENGADINWSVPGLYRYHVYVPLLDGQDVSGLTTKTYQGKTYYLRGDPLDTCDDADKDDIYAANNPSAFNYDEQTPPSIQGFNYLNYDYEKLSSGYSTDTYKDAYNMYFYYDRVSYNLEFNNYEESITHPIPYETDISGYGVAPSYPSNLEANAYEFEGWYTTQDFIPGTKVSFDNLTMPAHNVILFAHWVPKSHTVKIYQDASKETQLCDAFTVTHGELVPAEKRPGTPTNGSYTFVYWFYNDNGVEKAFDFNSMPVTKDMDIYAKWSSNTLEAYSVHYQLEDGQPIGPSTVYVADVTEGSALVGQTKTFYAKGGNDLYENYREGYFPTIQSHSFTIGIDSTNTYSFKYLQVPSVPYTVRYLEEGTNKVLADEKIDRNNKKAVVTENYKPISGYIPNEYQQTLVVTVNEDGSPNTEKNVITFYYTADKEHALYKTTHFTQTPDGKNWTEYLSTTNTGNVNTEYEASPITIPGFTFDSTVSGTNLKGTLTQNELLELKLYYKRNLYPYKVLYQEEGTGKNVADPKTKDSDGNPLKAAYESTVIENAITVPHYTLVSSEQQSCTIAMESGDDPVKNIMVFRYRENTATINYVAVGGGIVSRDAETLKVLTGTAQGSVAAANKGYRFVGWYNNPDCSGTSLSTNLNYVPAKVDGCNVAATYYAKFEPDVASLTITKAPGTDTTIGSDETFVFHIVGDQTNDLTKEINLTVTIKGVGSIVINDLPVGKYTVTEVTAWSSRYEPDEVSKEVTLVYSDTILNNNQVTFTNTMNKKQWLDGNGYTENVFRTVTAAPEAGN